MFRQSHDWNCLIGHAGAEGHIEDVAHLNKRRIYSSDYSVHGKSANCAQYTRNTVYSHAEIVGLAC